MFSLCSALFLFCCLYWLRVRCPKNSSEDLEHTLSGRVKGIEHRHLRFVGCLCIIISLKCDFLQCNKFKSQNREVSFPDVLHLL